MEKRKVQSLNERLNKFETIRKAKGLFYIDDLKKDIVNNLQSFTTNITKIYKSDMMTILKRNDINIPQINTFDNNQRLKYIYFQILRKIIINQFVILRDHLNILVSIQLLILNWTWN